MPRVLMLRNDGDRLAGHVYDVAAPDASRLVRERAAVWDAVRPERAVDSPHETRETADA